MDANLQFLGAADSVTGSRYLIDAIHETHGEPAASDTLRARIKRELHWPVHVPEHLERVRLTTHDRQEIPS